VARKKDDGCALSLLALVAFVIGMTLLDKLIHTPAVLIPVLCVAVTAIAIAVRRAVRTERQRRLDQAYQAELYSRRAREISTYQAMNPRDFEFAIAYLCRRDGCTGVQVVGGAGDLGADVIATAPDGRRIVIQCKRYSPTNKVGSPDMQRFGGTCFTVHGAHVAALVTTSVFTKPAKDYGNRSGIHCFDHLGLADWAARVGPAPWM
jgi:restriction system protein